LPPVSGSEASGRAAAPWAGGGSPALAGLAVGRRPLAPPRGPLAVWPVEHVPPPRPACAQGARGAAQTARQHSSSTTLTHLRSGEGLLQIEWLAHISALETRYACHFATVSARWRYESDPARYWS